MRLRHSIVVRNGVTLDLRPEEARVLALAASQNAALTEDELAHAEQMALLVLDKVQEETSK